MTQARPYLSLVLACYNEAEHLRGELRRDPGDAGAGGLALRGDLRRRREPGPHARRSSRRSWRRTRGLDLRLAPPRDEPGPRRHRHRRLPRRPGGDRRLPRRGPRGPPALHPVARPRDREGRRHRHRAAHLRLPAPLARPLLHEPRLLVRSCGGCWALPFRDTETGYKFFRRDAGPPAPRRGPGRRLVLGHRVHGARRPPGPVGGGDPRRLRAARGQDLDGPGPPRLGPLLPAAAALPAAARGGAP